VRNFCHLAETSYLLFIVLQKQRQVQLDQSTSTSILVAATSFAVELPCW